MQKVAVIQPSNNHGSSMPVQMPGHEVKSQGLSSSVSSIAKADEVTKSIVGRGITGLSTYLLSPDTDPELWDFNIKLYEEAVKEGLDPFPVVFLVDERDSLLSAAARMGFPVTMPHWKYGQEFNQLQKEHEYGVVKIFEMVINNNPSYAYLQRGNSRYDQKLVIGHVYAHSDFFKNNVWFKNTNRQMMDRHAQYAAYCDKILDQGVKPIELERFIEKAFSIENLIDRTVREPKKLAFDSTKDKEPEPLPDDFGTFDTSDMPKHIANRFNSPEEVAKLREEEMEKRRDALRKIPEYSDRDVIGFLIEHSPVLLPWQRMILSFVRENSYYLNPQAQTKIMNEGWASYWDEKLIRKPGVANPNEFVEIADHKSGTLAMSPGQINPYKIGVELFKDIEERWNKGQHGQEWEELENRTTHKEWDTKEMKGRQKIFDVRRFYKDYEFIDEFLTRELAEELKLFTIEYNEPNNQYVIGSREFNAVKSHILDMLANSGQPAIVVINGNHDNKGELLLGNESGDELKNDYTVRTLKNMHAIWGRPVHLDTTLDNNLVRYSVDIVDTWDTGAYKKEYSIKVFKLKKEEENGKSRFVIDGSAISETKEKFDEELT